MLCDGWCGECYSGRRGRGTFRGHWGFRAEQARQVRCRRMPYIRKGDDGGRERVELALEPCSVMGRFPLVWEFLTDATFSDGSRRELPTITVFVDAGRFKACINDRAEGMVAFVTANTVVGLLEALEAGLDEGNLDWRRQQGGRRKT